MTDLINAGVYVLEPSVLDHVPAGQPSSFERNLFPSLLASGAPTYGYELHATGATWVPRSPIWPPSSTCSRACCLPINATERGRASGFADETHVDEGPYSAAPSWSARARSWRTRAACSDRPCSAPARWWPAAPGAVGAAGGGAGRAGAKVSDSIIGRGVVVGDGAVVRDGAVVGDGVEIEAGNILAGRVRVAPNVRLGLGAIRFWRRSAPGPATCRRRGPCSRSRTPGRRRC